MAKQEAGQGRAEGPPAWPTRGLPASCDEMFRPACDHVGDVPAGRGPVVHARRPGLLQQRLQARDASGNVPAGAHGQRGQDHQRHDHRPRRFVGVMIHVLVARLAGKGHVPQAEHVEGRDAGPAHRRPETASRAADCSLERERLARDVVFRVVAAQADQQSACPPRQSPGSRPAWCRRSRASFATARPSAAFRWCRWRGSPSRSRGTAGT